MASDSKGWQHEPILEDKLAVSSHAVSGSSLVLVRRSTVEYDVDAKALFVLLRSPTGFKIIDPDTKNHEDEPAKTLTGYDDSEWDKVILTYAKTELAWPFGPRYFTSFCAGNKAEMLFLGKSIIDPDIVPDNGRIKCLTTYAYRVVPLKDGRCRLEQLCYLDMGGDHLEGDLKAVNPDEVELKP